MLVHIRDPVLHTFDQIEAKIIFKVRPLHGANTEFQSRKYDQLRCYGIFRQKDDIGDVWPG